MAILQRTRTVGKRTHFHPADCGPLYVAVPWAIFFGLLIGLGVIGGGVILSYAVSGLAYALGWVR